MIVGKAPVNRVLYGLTEFQPDAPYWDAQVKQALLCKPTRKGSIWGDQSLGRHLLADVALAESWEIAGHEDGTATARRGGLQKQSRAEQAAAR